MNTQTKMQKNRFVSIGVAAVLAATVGGMGAAMAGTLDASWKEATLAQVKSMLAKDTGKVSGDTVTYSGKTVHVVVAAVLPGFPFPSFEVHDKKNPTLDIPAGATVDVTFVNTNKGFGHSFDITKKGPPFAVMPNIKPIVAGTGFSPVPKDGKFGYSEFTWHPAAGTYYYVCQIPGHAATGMFGKIVVK